MAANNMLPDEDQAIVLRHYSGVSYAHRATCEKHGPLTGNLCEHCLEAISGMQPILRPTAVISFAFQLLWSCCEIALSFLEQQLCSILLIPQSKEVKLTEGSHSADCAASKASETSSLGEKAFQKAMVVFNNIVFAHYGYHYADAEYQLQVNGHRRLCAQNDCSGFISYLLHSVSPKHYSIIRNVQPERPYPQANAYAQFFAWLRPGAPQAGWLRIGNYRDLQRGDIIVWTTVHRGQDHAGNGNAGHIMLVAAPPSQVFEDLVDGHALRFVYVQVIDSSSVQHFPPEELPPFAHQRNRNGIGVGYVRIYLSPENLPIGYWEGQYWLVGQKQIVAPARSNGIYFARMLPLPDPVARAVPDFPDKASTSNMMLIAFSWARRQLAEYLPVLSGILYRKARAGKLKDSGGKVTKTRSGK